MKRVWITQCLCPARHCILATAGEADGREEAEQLVEAPLRASIAEQLAGNSLNPWCGICHAAAAAWSYETRRTRWATLAEAVPALQATEAENIAAAAAVGEILGARSRRPN